MKNITCPESVLNLYNLSPGLFEPLDVLLGVTAGARNIEEIGFPKIKKNYS